ncbi:MAG: histidine kinase [Bacteroidales bacterium]|nr:histidine kinase [Bacteroidales bacterium]HPD95046.1 histidine kinase [Tenuifilaceae bacterium]HRX32363.1 histidine kinase [Tenuifilaceae bacterium]
MKFVSENIILSDKYRSIWNILYWILAALLLLLIFSNSSYDFRIRITVTIILTVMSFGVSYFINYFLIPRYLFNGEIFKFLYLLLFSVIFSVWINIMAIIFIIWYTAYHYPLSSLPNKTDLILLVSGSFLIILFAAIVHFIKETYTKLIERNKAEQQKMETELKLKEAKLKLLQGQLHPHFLFNMLNNLYGLWMENSQTTPEIILKLSTLLDYMLYECDKEKVPLANEIQFIQNYIDLEKLRHDNRLSVKFDYPKITDNYNIAPLILFTFVENAFKHGANKSSGKSNIAITIIVKNEQLNFEIVNNFDSEKSTATNGLGLKNVEERLNLLYGKKYMLKVENDNNEFRVLLHLDLT